MSVIKRGLDIIAVEKEQNERMIRVLTNLQRGLAVLLVLFVAYLGLTLTELYLRLNP